MNNVYIYDQELSAKKYQKLLERLETRLTDLGISGKIVRLGPLTRLETVIKQELAKKPKTIVAVGGDGLISRLAGLVVGSDIPLAIVPVGKSMIADALGITLENACKTLAARRLLKLDVGRVDGQHSFVCRAVITTNEPVMKLDGDLSVTAQGRSTIETINVSGDDFGYMGATPLPDDGRLNVYILKTEKGILRKDISQSAFICKRLDIIRGAISVELDGALEITGAKSIDIARGVLTAIVGRERSF